jgi:hypothetical protein
MRLLATAKTAGRLPVNEGSRRWRAAERGRIFVTGSQAITVSPAHGKRSCAAPTANRAGVSAKFKRSLVALERVITSSARAKAERILRLALCPGAPEGEWQSAAYALIRTLRSAGARAEDVLSQVSGTTSTAASSPIICFGKYRDRTVRWIIENDPSYAEWVLRKVTNLSPSLRREFRSELSQRYGDAAQGGSK